MNDGGDVARFAVTCPACERAVMPTVHAHWDVRAASFRQRWFATECPRCSSTGLYRQERLLEWSDEPEGGWSEHEQVYPPGPRLVSRAIPARLRNDYSEMRGCLGATYYTSAASGARRLLEGICEDRGYRNGMLVARLTKMRDEGVIDARLYEWADVCRQVGNEGAHPSKVRVSREDAEEVVAFVEALLDYLYVFQERFDAFKKRRDAEREKRRPPGTPDVATAPRPAAPAQSAKKKAASPQPPPQPAQQAKKKAAQPSAPQAKKQQPATQKPKKKPAAKQG